MNKYEKPIVVTNDELSEGIYTASGDCFYYVWAWSPTKDGLMYKLGAQIDYDWSQMSHGNPGVATVNKVTVDLKISASSDFNCVSAEMVTGTGETIGINVDGVIPVTGGWNVRVSLPGSNLGSVTGGFAVQIFVNSSTEPNITGASVYCDHSF